MAIDGGMREKLEPGMKLVARYQGKEQRAEVVAGEDGKVRFRLADGREFKSLSAAGSAVMGGTACNGWRFWSVAEEQANAKAAKPKAGGTAKLKTAAHSEAEPPAA